MDTRKPFSVVSLLALAVCLSGCFDKPTPTDIYLEELSQYSLDIADSYPLYDALRDLEALTTATYQFEPELLAYLQSNSPLLTQTRRLNAAQVLKLIRVETRRQVNFDYIYIPDSNTLQLFQSE